MREFSAWTPRQVIIATLIASGILLAFYLVFAFRFVLFALFTAILLSTAIRPLSEWLVRRGLPRSLSTGIVLLLIFVGLGLFIFGLVPIITESGATVAESGQRFYSNMRTMLIESPSALIRRLAYNLPWSLSFSSASAAAEGSARSSALSQAVGLAGQVLSFLLVFFAIMLLTFFWLVEGERALRSIFMFFPTAQRIKAQDFYYEMEHNVGSYLRGVVGLCLAVGTLALIAYLIIGLPNPFFLALVAGVFEAVPMVGPILGAIPALMIALTVDPSKAVGVLIATFIIQMAENYILVPRIMRQAAGVNGFVTLLALAAFGSIFGLAGALLAIPLAVVIQMVVQRFLLAPDSPVTSQPEGRDTTSRLRYEAQELVQDIRKRIREKEEDLGEKSDQVEETIEALANDLDSILAGLPSAPEKELEA